MGAEKEVTVRCDQYFLKNRSLLLLVVSREPKMRFDGQELKAITVNKGRLETFLVVTARMGDGV